MSARSIALGIGPPSSRYGTGDAAITGQLPAGSGWLSPVWSHGALVEPLAPEWPSCIAILASLSRCTKSTMRFHALACASFHKPGQPGVMRASGDGQVI